MTFRMSFVLAFIAAGWLAISWHLLHQVNTLSDENTYLRNGCGVP